MNASFTEDEGVMREKDGNKGTVVIVVRNQEQIDLHKDNSNMGGKSDDLNVILEAKRKRIETEK